MQTFAELSARDKFIEVVRWILVPAAAVMVVVALNVIARAVMPPALAQPPGTPRVPPSAVQRFVLPHLSSILLGLGIVIAAAKMAPRLRVLTAAMVATVWIALALQSHLLVHGSPDTRHYLHFAVAAAAAVGGVAFVWYTDNRKEKPKMRVDCCHEDPRCADARAVAGVAGEAP
jgi:hypothetical protein